MKSIYTILLVAWNIVVFFMYGLDKFLAKNHMWRISEKALLGAAFAGGGVGALMGMKHFRHKTKHDKFTKSLPIAALITFALVGAILNDSKI